jgi:ferredoxin
VSDPGKVHSGQVGVAVLADPRLDFLASLHNPKKVTPATVEFLDTPGLMPGTHGDNPQRLAVIREGDALLIVLNGFSGGDPAAELSSFREEMLFADLGAVTNRVERLEASVKKRRPDWEVQEKELAIVKRVQATLEDGKFVSTLGLSADEKKPLRSFGLLTDKPQVVVLNAAQGEEIPTPLRELAADALAIDAKLELDLAQLDLEERSAFWTEQFSKCVRCYACRQVCPLCVCERCVAEKSRPQWIEASPHARGNLSWNITRALHLAGRCVDCGECERFCPVGIPLSLVNRKLQQIVAERYDYTVSDDPENAAPIGDYRLDDQQEFIK